jgi:hypothetical protein
MSSFIAWEEGTFIVQEYDHQSLCLLLLKCYEQLHHFSKNSNVSQLIQRNTNVTCSFNIFGMASCGVELALEHVIVSYRHFNDGKSMSTTSSALCNSIKNIK